MPTDATPGAADADAAAAAAAGAGGKAVSSARAAGFSGTASSEESPLRGRTKMDSSAAIPFR